MIYKEGPMEENRMEKLEDDALDEVVGGINIPSFLKRKKADPPKDNVNPMVNGIQTTRLNPNDQIKSC